MGMLMGCCGESLGGWARLINQQQHIHTVLATIHQKDQTCRKRR